MIMAKYKKAVLKRAECSQSAALLIFWFLYKLAPGMLFLPFHPEMEQNHSNCAADIKSGNNHEHPGEKTPARGADIINRKIDENAAK